MPAIPIELKNSLPDLDLNPGRRESSAHQTSSNECQWRLILMETTARVSALSVAYTDMLCRHTSNLGTGFLEIGLL